MPLGKGLRDLILYIGIGCAIVGLVVLASFFFPRAAEFGARWIVFGGVTGFVFGYQLRDFWHRRYTLRFWLPFVGLFACHLALWMFFIHPHFGGDPRLGMGFVLTFAEYVIVSVTIRASVASPRLKRNL